MHPIPSNPRSLEGLFFDLPDLQLAMTWASLHPRLRVTVRTNYRNIPEVIEIYLVGSGLPRWRLWRDRDGRLHVDDWTKGKFNLPYSTVKTALAFIGESLVDKPHEQGRPS